MNANTLLADHNAIEIEKFVSLDDSIVIVAKTIQPTANCPRCDQPSSSLKTHYLRRLADLPLHNVSVRLELQARKFRCRNELCACKVFCERLPNVVAPFSRRTFRLANAIELLSFALGARAGARTAVKLSFPVGKDVCLWAMRRSDLTSVNNKVSVLGVDDFAFRRGQTYGTILTDLESRCPIDLLPDRTAETLKTWLASRPEIEIVSRDRSVVYAEAIKSGAPQAAQVADRWHLLKNLSDLVERFFVQNQCCLTSAATEIRFEERAKQTESSPAAQEQPANICKAKTPVPARRQKLFDSIKELQSQGKSRRAIARELKISRTTVRRYIDCESIPRSSSAGRGRKPAVLPFAKYLRNRWQAGERNAFRLWQEIKTQGFPGQVDAVQRFVREWRKTEIGKKPYSISALGLSPRLVAKLLLNPESAKNEDEGNYLAKIRENNPVVQIVQSLGIGFQQIVKEKQLDLFDDWLSRVKTSGVTDFENWANGLLADESAVRNALSSAWSNGQTEGQVNRLKTIKRQMYGRAKFDLLRARVLHQD